MMNAIYVVLIVGIVFYFVYSFIFKEYIPKSAEKSVCMINVTASIRYKKLADDKKKYDKLFCFKTLSGYIKDKLEILSFTDLKEMQSYKIKNINDSKISNYEMHLKDELNSFMDMMMQNSKQQGISEIDQEMIDFVAYVFKTTEFIKALQSVMNTKTTNNVIFEMLSNFKKPLLKPKKEKENFDGLDKKLCIN